MSTALPTIPLDDRKRNLTLAQPDKDQTLPHIGLAGDTYTITVTGDETGGRFCLVDMYIPPGGGPPPHRHNFEETFILLEGRSKQPSVARRRSFRAGDTLSIPSNAPHQFHNASTGPAPALYLLSGGTGEILHGGWGTGSHTYDAPAKAGRKRAGCIHRESESARTQVPH